MSYASFSPCSRHRSGAAPQSSYHLLRQEVALGAVVAKLGPTGSIASLIGIPPAVAAIVLAVVLR